MPELSVVIPAYNEESRLLPVLQSVYSFLANQSMSFEIIVVNDGSVDGTANFVNQFAEGREGVKLITYDTNKGKGFALKKGVLAACGDLILIDDADGSAAIAEYERLREAIKNGADLAIGSRNKPDKTIKINALPYRTHIGNTFNRIVQYLLLPGLYDTQCGFKLFKKEVGHNLFALCTVDGYAFDVEILYLARLKKYRLEEIAINWNNVAGSKVNVFIDSFKMLLAVLKIKLKSLSGKYQENNLREIQNINGCSSSTK